MRVDCGHAWLSLRFESSRNRGFYAGEIDIRHRFAKMLTKKHP